MRNSPCDRANQVRHLKRHPAPTRRYRRFRPRLEGLADRTVLSTLMVTNNHDSGPGSLRATIAVAASGDTIAFSAKVNGKTITLTSGELAISKSLDIEGPGANRLSISGNGTSRIFNISGGVIVTIAGLTIADGFVLSDDGGGGILNQDSALSLAGDTFSNNEAMGLGGSNSYVQGGAVNCLASTTLTVTDCRFSKNQVAGGPQGEGVGGGAIGTFGNASVVDSRVTDNLARGGDGGIAPRMPSSPGTRKVAPSSITRVPSPWIGAFSRITRPSRAAAPAGGAAFISSTGLMAVP
jgi:hypothetical protein